MGNFPGHFNQISVVHDAKILGRQCSYDKNFTCAINHRVSEAKDSWAGVRSSFLRNTNVRINVKLNSPHALMRSVLSYGVLYFNIDDASLKTTHSFYPKRTR